MKHLNFDIAFYRFACHLQDNLGQSASNREYICRESSGSDSSGNYILRGINGDIVAQVQGRKVTL